MTAFHRSYRRAFRHAGASRLNLGRAVIVAAVLLAAGGATSTVAAHHHHGGTAAPATVAAAPSSPSGNAALGQQMAAQRGWAGQQWNCLWALWNKESGWSATATNPTSGAYGVAQSLHGTPGIEYNASDPEGLTGPQLAAANRGSAYWQIDWGLGYIADDYGNPCQAWAHETANDWY